MLSLMLFGCEKYEEGGCKGDIEAELINTYWQVQHYYENGGDSTHVLDAYFDRDIRLRFLRETKTMTPVFHYQQDSFLRNCQGSWEILNNDEDMQLTLMNLDDSTQCQLRGVPPYDNVWKIKRHEDGELKLNVNDTVINTDTLVQVLTYELFLTQVED